MAKEKEILKDYKNAFKSAYSEIAPRLLAAKDEIDKAARYILCKMKAVGSGSMKPEIALLSILEDIDLLNCAVRDIGDYCRYMNTLNTDLLKGERDA